MPRSYSVGSRTEREDRSGGHDPDRIDVQDAATCQAALIALDSRSVNAFSRQPAVRAGVVVADGAGDAERRSLP